MLTGHHYEGRRGDLPSDFTNPQNKTAVWVAALGTLACIGIVGQAWATTYFTLSINPPDPTADEVAFFTRRAVIAAIVFVASILTTIVIGRGNGASWLRSVGLALAGIVCGIGAGVAALLVIF